MELKRNGTQASAKGPEAYFTGNVRVDPLFEAPEPSRGRGALVTFEPGGRSAWHFHPLGQTLIVTQGCGWVQSEGGPKVEIRPGDEYKPVKIREAAKVVEDFLSRSRQRRTVVYALVEETGPSEVIISFSLTSGGH